MKFHKFVSILLVLFILIPVNIKAGDGITITDLSAGKDYFNVNDNCSVSFNIRNTNDFMKEIEITIQVFLGSSQVIDEKYNRPIAANPTVTQETKKITLGSAGVYTVHVYTEKGTTNEEHKTISFQVYDTKVEAYPLNNIDTYFRYSNDDVVFYTTVHNVNANATSYSVSMALKSPSNAPIFQESNVTSIPKMSSKTFTRTYKIKSSDPIGTWTIYAEAIPDGHTNAKATSSRNIYIRDPEIDASFVVPTSISSDGTGSAKRNLIINSLLTNKSDKHLYFDITYKIISSGQPVYQDKISSILVQPTGDIPFTYQILPQAELPKGTYQIYFLVEIPASNISRTATYDFVVGDYIPPFSYKVKWMETPKLNKNLEVRLTLSNQNTQFAETYSSILYYIKNPEGTVLFTNTVHNVVLSPVGRDKDSQTYVMNIVPDIMGSYDVWFSINNSTNHVLAGSTTIDEYSGPLVSLDNIQYYPGNTITMDGSVTIAFDLVNNGNEGVTTYYDIIFENGKIKEGGAEILPPQFRKTITKKINAFDIGPGTHKFYLKSNWITEDGVNHPTELLQYLQINTASAKQLSIESINIAGSTDTGRTPYVKPGTFLVILKVKNNEDTYVSGNIRITYSPSLEGTIEQQYSFNPGQTLPIEIQVTALREDPGAFMSIMVSGTDGTGTVGQYRNIIVMSEADYKKITTIDTRKNIGDYIAPIAIILLIVVAFLYFKGGKKPKLEPA